MPLMRLPSRDIAAGLLLLSWAEFGEVCGPRFFLLFSGTFAEPWLLLSFIPHLRPKELGGWVVELRGSWDANGD